MSLRWVQRWFFSFCLTWRKDGHPALPCGHPTHPAGPFVESPFKHGLAATFRLNRREAAGIPRLAGHVPPDALTGGREVPFAEVDGALEAQGVKVGQVVG